jgi:bilirubin oxidase
MLIPLLLLGSAAAMGPQMPVLPPDTFYQPQVLRSAPSAPGVKEFTLTAAGTFQRLVPSGPPINALAYNGSIPGPTLDVREGDSVIVHFHNRMGVPSTIHWHGLHLPASSDGSPYDLVPPNSDRDYAFRLRPGSAGTYWYHPHPHHDTGNQVGRGLFGVLIVRAADDPLAGIPERVLVLADNRFAADGSIDFPDPHSPNGHRDRENGREGDVLFVNGEVLPTLAIRSGEVQRWRVINASAARSYRLSIPGAPFVHVANDGGLFELPRETSEIVVAASERVELLVRGVGAPGSRSELQALPYDRYVPQTRPDDWQQTRTLLTLQYTAELPLRPVALPTRLRVIPALDTLQATVRRVIALSQGMINGRTMDMARVDEHGRLGTTEIWEVENLVGMDHPFHLHGFQFQVLDRNGVPEPYRSWKDTVNVPRHQAVRFIVRFDDFAGKWMYHCHILDHEDHGMMGVLELN